MTQNISIPCSQRNFSRVEEIISKFDLHSICSSTGPIYESLQSVLEKNFKENPSHFPTPNLNVAQLMHLTVMVVCFLDDIDCPPIVKIPASRRNLSQSQRIKETLKENESWVSELDSHIKHIGGKIYQFASSCKKKTKQAKLANDFSYVKNEINAAMKSMNDVNESLNCKQCESGGIAFERASEIREKLSTMMEMAKNQLKLVNELKANCK